MSFEIEVQAGSSVRLPTAGKYCDRDIVVSAVEGAGSYDEGYEAGQQAEYDRFWDVCQQNGNRDDYTYAFYGEGWTDETFQPKYDITGIIANAFRGSAMKNISKNIVVQGNCTNAFNYASVVTISSIDMTAASNTTTCFNNASKLQNVTFAGKILGPLNMSTCPLSNASVQSVIDHLGNVSATLTLKDTVGAALTDAQKAEISAKNWTLVY